jgi:hypothetical protein
MHRFKQMHSNGCKRFRVPTFNSVIKPWSGSINMVMLDSKAHRQGSQKAFTPLKCHTTWATKFAIMNFGKGELQNSQANRRIRF